MRITILLYLISSLAIAASNPEELKRMSQAVPEMVEFQTSDPRELYLQVIKRMEDSLPTPRERALFRRAIPPDIAPLYHGRLFGKYTDEWNTIAIGIPFPLGNTSVDYMVRIHELAHALWNIRTDGPNRAGSSLQFAKMVLFNEDHSYRWEWLYLHALSDDERGHVLGLLRDYYVDPDATIVLQRVYSNAVLPLSEYLKLERKAERHPIRKLVRKRLIYISMVVAMAVVPPVAWAVGCSELLHLFR